MTLEEHLERSGHWLFRWRSYLPLLLAAFVVLGLRGFEYPAGRGDLYTWWCVGCLLVGLTGIGIRGLTVGHIPPRTSGRNTREQVADALNTTGMYSIVRNPLYLGNYLAWLSVALVSYTLWVPVVITLVFWLYHERIMFVEEQFLRKKFGDEFEEWAARTPAFVPAFARWVAPQLPFRMRIALRREHSGLLCLVLAITVVMLAGELVATGHVVMSPAWTALVGATMLLYAVVFVLKKKTRLLHVER